MDLGSIFLQIKPLRSLLFEGLSLSTLVAILLDRCSFLLMMISLQKLEIDEKSLKFQEQLIILFSLYF